MCTPGCIVSDDTGWDRYTPGVYLLTHAPLCCTCGVDCERSCNVDVGPVADICDTGGCRRRCTLCCSIMAMVAAVLGQPTHWRMKQNQSMTLQNCDAKYVSRYNAYTSTGGGSTERSTDGMSVFHI